MKNTIINSVIIGSMILFAANVSATGNETRRAAKDSDKSRKEILKFSVNDFVGMHDPDADENDLLDSLNTESQENISSDNEPSDKSIENNSIH